MNEVKESLNLMYEVAYNGFVNINKSIVAQAPIPEHIGFIMDGNRRYARKRGLEIKQGHEAGDESLRRVNLGFFKNVLIFLFLN